MRKAHKTGSTDNGTERCHDLEDIGALLQRCSGSHLSEEPVVDLTVSGYQGQRGIAVVPEGILGARLHRHTSAAIGAFTNG